MSGDSMVPTEVLASAIIGNAVGAGPAALQPGSFGVTLATVTLNQQYRLTGNPVNPALLASEINVTIGTANPFVPPGDSRVVVITREPGTSSVLISILDAVTGALANVEDPTIVVTFRRPFVPGQ